MSTPTQPVKRLLSKKYYLRTFYFRLFLVALNLFIAYQSYQREEFASAGAWVIFTGVWLFLAGLDRKNMLLAEAFEQEHGKPAEREAKRTQDAIENMMKDANVIKLDVEPVATSEEPKIVPRKRVNSYEGKYGVNVDADGNEYPTSINDSVSSPEK